MLPINDTCNACYQSMTCYQSFMQQEFDTIAEVAEGLDTGAAEDPDDGKVAGSVNGATVVPVVGVTVHVTR